jgi:hypothetical protein
VCGKVVAESCADQGHFKWLCRLDRRKRARR